jgi:hypothetical protein
MYGKGLRELLSSLAVVAALVVTAASANAQGRRVFEWSGRVDPNIELHVSGKAYVTTRISSTVRVPRGSASLVNVPRSDGELTLETIEGHGDVDVVQQPQSANDYTAIIRIRPISGTPAEFHIAAYWQGVAAGEVSSTFEAPPPPPPVIEERVIDRTALIWSGDVDSELEIIIRPGGVSYIVIRGEEPRGVQAGLRATPWPAARLFVNQIEGRGEASIIEQPSAANGYTARFRVRDPQPGFGHYVFMAIWQ